MNSYQEFLKHRHEFQLGNLSTERSHPHTKNLEQLSQHRPVEIIKKMVDIDLHMLRYFNSKLIEDDLYIQLKRIVAKTILQGNKIFIFGFGSAGRMAVLLEHTFRSMNSIGIHEVSPVVGLIAEGDNSIIQMVGQSPEGGSIEDSEEMGKKFIQRAGVVREDLVIVLSEGGETPYSVGVALEAVQLSSQHVFYLFCNKEHILFQDFQRLHSVLNNERIVRIALDSGPMALSGSTRMQACTILGLYVGLSLTHYENDDSLLRDELNEIENLIDHYNDLDVEALARVIEIESKIFQQGKEVLFTFDGRLGFPLLIDLVECIPTFSYPSFLSENHFFHFKLLNDEKEYSSNTDEFWQKILGRSFQGEKNYSLNKFKIGEEFIFRESNDEILYSLAGEVGQINISGQSYFFKNIFFKMILNIISTLCFARCGRVYQNFMLYVRPSNFKLMDRCSRIIEEMLKEKGLSVDKAIYEEKLFFRLSLLKNDESIVLKVFQELI